jgi:tRNA dimethylallyltransferase
MRGPTTLEKPFNGAIDIMTEPSKKLPIILLAGATGVGKTALSLELASRLDTEIVNADSMQVYRFMDIGTAKPTDAERARVPHHLLDVVDPDEPFDAAAYAGLAHRTIAGLHRRGKIPLVVGGTGLYLKVLTRGICQGPVVDPAVRRDLKRRAEAEGIASLHAELKSVDAVLGASLHPHDRQRILRALEVFRSTGRPLSDWQASHRFEQTLYPTVKLFLHRSREELYRRIDRRVIEMMDSGFLDEVRGLLRMGYGPGLKPMQSLGYRQLVLHLASGLPLEAAVEEIQRETRRYAKRQLTWFRGDPELHWMDADDAEAVMAWVERRLATMTTGEDRC